jgi:hypothetical protein
MGATKTISTFKDDVSFDTRTMDLDGIVVTEHIYPELQTMELRLVSDEKKEGAQNRVIEIVVKREAGDAIKSAFLQVRRLCTEKN